MKRTIIKLMLTLLLLTGLTMTYTPQDGLSLEVRTETRAENDPFDFCDDDSWWDDVWDWIDDAIDDIGDWISDAIDDIGDWIDNAIDDIGDFFDDFFDGSEFDDGDGYDDGAYDYSYDDNDNDDGDEYEDDPCSWGDCEDDNDNNSNSDNDDPEPVECEGETCTICGKFLSVTQGENCQMCEGHVEDCMGVMGGKAYTKTCGGQEICIDGNAGLFNNQLTGQDLDTYNTMITNMQENCMQKKLLEQLNANYGLSVKIDSNKSNYASFDACSNSIIFNSSASIGDIDAVTAELFHAYQEQYLQGKLSQIISDAAHIGGSNTEFEKKAMIFFVKMFGSGYGSVPSQEKLEEWVEDFRDNHDFSSGITELTEAERVAWFEALEAFRSYYVNDGSLYGTPIDYSMLPVSLLSLLSNSDCM